MPSPIPPTEHQIVPSAPFHSLLIQDASLSSTQIFSEQVASVLHHTSASFLKRRISQKIQDQLSKLPYETLKNCDAASLISESSPIEICEQDVMDCETFAKRVGSQWEKVLRQRGYIEFADVVHQLLDKGSFLEISDDGNCPQAKEPIAADEETNQVDDISSKFMTPYAALNSLRRYEPDCNETGDPLNNIQSLSDCVNGTSSARRVTQKIDRMMKSIDRKDLRATYGYDWDAIEEAAKQNEKRLYVFQPTVRDEEYEVVPKSFDVDNTQDSGDNCDAEDLQPKEKTVRFKEGQTDKNEAVDANFLIATHTLTARVLKRKRKLEERNQADGSSLCSDDEERGRQPSTLQDAEWALDDIIQSIPAVERRKLIRSGIHPPFPPVENDSNNKMDDDENSSEAEDHSAVVCGALRTFGSTHLWEQTLNFPPKDEQLEASENKTQQHKSQRLVRLQKRALRRAIKERTAPRTISDTSMRSEYVDKSNKSKTKWTEYRKEDDIESTDEVQMTDFGSNREDVVQPHRLTGSPTEQQPNLWLEMDLGQCTVELASENHDTDETADEAGTKRILSFRSLELAMQF